LHQHGPHRAGRRRELTRGTPRGAPSHGISGRQRHRRAEGGGPDRTAVCRGRRGLHDGPRRPAAARPASGPARGERGPGGAHAGDAIQEPRRRLGAVGRSQRHLEGYRRADAFPDGLERPAGGERTTKHHRGREPRHGARSRLVALAMVEATVVANGRMTTGAPMVVACLITVAVVGAGCGRETKIVAPPAPEVSVSQPLEEPVQESLEFTGRTSAIQSVEVHARVTGYITKVGFTAGALVKVGDLLFEIDPREYQAAVLRAEGDVARLRAQLARAESEVARNQSLRPSGAASARELEKAIADRGAAEGDLKAKLAQLDLARLDVEFSRVTAPID